ncbi:acyl carrier protein [Lachnospiraceae bacterium WCA-9-b2]|jgi:acyl carrier protein|uniref:Acyl carrier protein n=1 Tax=Sporofaciens musculi TaxID=2681861 RepID=A0A7X3MJW4_9FIRM|nr:acyl carrier protein [Sporofaciens musculi]MCI9423135.1 acyl carrier protein [Dorea sp.]MXP77798.1 acyl carrier protein [Sporofaciens musculi]
MLEKIKEIVSENLGVDSAQITEASSFKDDLGADSLDLFEMVMALEDEYEIEIPTEDLEQIATVGDVVNYISAHKE